MSKRIETEKTALFELEPDGFSIHTFELTKKITKHEYGTIKNSLYHAQKKSKEVIIYQECKGSHYCRAFERNGVRMRLEHNQSESDFDTYFVRMIVNPRMLIEPGCSYLGILPPKKSSIKKVKESFKELFERTVFEHEIESYYLSRVDLCTNIRCSSSRLFRELVRVLRKLPTPSKYKRIVYKHKDKKKANQYNKHYMRFSCGTHELIIYDKTYQVRDGKLITDYEKLPEGVLRYEVHCERAYIKKIEKKLDKADVLDVLWMLIQESEERIIDHFSRCFSDVVFMQIDELKRIIKESRFRPKDKEAMLELTAQLQRIQSVDKALKETKKKGFDTSKVLDRFEKLGISPIPLWKNFCAKSLPGPVELLRDISQGEIAVKYTKTKYK